MNHHLLTPILITLAITNLSGNGHKGQILGATTEQYKTDFETHPTQIQTQTAFEQTKIEEYEPIEFETEYIDDDETEYGTETIIQDGINGTKTYHYLLTHWLGDTIDKQLLSTNVKEPIAQKISRGTKVVWRTINTPDEGEIRYWHKMRVWATKYDSTCEGCNHTTAVGAYLQKGVCAVDPTVIKMWTSFYVEGYGRCTALDVGGAIKGKKIDLAYENAAEAAWGAAYTDIYLINNEPD